MQILKKINKMFKGENILEMLLKYMYMDGLYSKPTG